MADFLILDVGGANLVVEVETSNFERRKDRSGTDISRSYSGKKMVTETYPDKLVFPPFQTGPLTVEELLAIEAAAQWPATIPVGGPALRNTTANTVPQTIDATVLVESAKDMAVGDDWIYLATITLEEDE
jgi:hypothetical protein